MSQTLFVQEDKQWANHSGESAQYQRIARAWNAIHVYLIRNPDALCTDTVTMRLVFFRYKGELLMVEEFDTDAMVGDGLLSLNDIHGQSEEDLADLAEAMESWLRAPNCIKRTAKHSSVVDLLDEKPDDSLMAEFRPQYLTAVIPPSIANSFIDRAEEINMPDHLDFRA